MSEMDVLFPLPDGRRNADDMGMPSPSPDADIDALVESLRDNASQYLDHSDEWGEAADAIIALRQERDHATVRADTNYASYKMASEERDAARAENERLRALLMDAKRFTPLPTSQRIDAALRREGIGPARGE